MDILKLKILKISILTVCASIMPQLFFKNGFLLAFLLSLGMAESQVLVLLSLPSLILLVFLVPFAYYADCYGKKRIGNIGIYFTIAGYVLITMSGFFKGQAIINCVTAGILLFGVGLSAIFSGWFALLSPLIPNEIRGRFFGTLRLFWQLFAILCSVLITVILDKTADLSVYQSILGFFTVLLIFQIRFYKQIPEVNGSSKERKPLMTIMAGLGHVPGYLPFSAYCFLLLLATGAWPVTLGLLEKDILSFSDDTIVFMGTMLFLGSMIGFYTGGKLVDRYGTKVVFLSVHFLYFLLLSLVLVRSVSPVSMVWFFSALTLCLGLVQAASTIAMTSEMIALAPPENTSVITSICMALQWGGAALSGMISGKAIEFKILAEKWELWGMQISQYDSLILFYAVMVLVFTVTLGLIPSVMKSRRAEWGGPAPKTL